MKNKHFMECGGLLPLSICHKNKRSFHATQSGSKPPHSIFAKKLLFFAYFRLS
jgi:hypothetical protein